MLATLARCFGPEFGCEFGCEFAYVEKHLNQTFGSRFLEDGKHSQLPEPEGVLPGHLVLWISPRVRCEAPGEAGSWCWGKLKLISFCLALCWLSGGCCPVAEAAKAEVSSPFSPLPGKRDVGRGEMREQGLPWACYVTNKCSLETLLLVAFPSVPVGCFT